MNKEIEVYNQHNINLKNKKIGQIKTSCPFCTHTKSESLSVNLDKGVYNCHYCGVSGSLHKYKYINNEKYIIPTYHYSNNKLSEKVIEWFNKRGISEQTLIKAKIDEDNKFVPQAKKKRNVIIFPYFVDGICINKKFRDAEKNFFMVKDAQKVLYNIDNIFSNDEMIIHEGEIDVLSSIEAGIYNSVSVPNGATKGNVNLDFIDDFYDEYIKDKKKIILAGDNDAAGVNLRNKLAERFGKTKCYVVDWKDCKDGNEFLIKYGKEEYIIAINEATLFPIEGIWTINTCFDKLLYEHEHGVEKGSPCHVKSLEKHFSWMKKDVYVFAGYNNHGKTEATYWLQMLKSIKDGWKWAIAALEEKTPERFYRKLIETYVGKRLDPIQKNYNNQMSLTELNEAKDFIAEHFFFIKPPNEFSTNKIMDIFDHVVAKHGVDGICIDPYNKLVKNKTSGLRDDELLVAYYAQQEIFATSHNVVASTITHINKPMVSREGIPDKPSSFNILGGQATGNAVDQIMFIYRNREEKTAPERMFIVEKVRDRDLIGTPGDAELKFNFKKRRFLDNGNDPIIGYDTTTQRTKPIWTPYKDDDDDFNIIDAPF